MKVNSRHVNNILVIGLIKNVISIAVNYNPIYYCIMTSNKIIH